MEKLCRTNDVFFVNKLYKYYDLKILIYTTLLLLYSYGFKIFNASISIDSEIALLYVTPYDWINDGRFGTALLLYLLNFSPFNPYVSNLLSGLFLFIAAFLTNWIYHADENDERDNKFDYIFIGLFVTTPSLAELFNFCTFNFTVMAGMALISLGVYFAVYDNTKKSVCISVLCLTFSLGIYQSLVTVYVGMILSFILYKNRYETLFKSLKILFASLVLYKVVDKVLHPTASSYINGFVYWGKYSTIDILNAQLAFVRRLALGEIYPLSFLLLLAMLACCIYGLKIIFCSKVNPQPYSTIISLSIVILFLLSPFYFNIFFGSILPVRSNVVIPLYVSFSAILILKLLKDIKARYASLVCVSFICCCGWLIFMQASKVSYMMYGEVLKSTNEYIVAHKLGMQIEAIEKDYDNKLPVVFLGKRDNNIPKSILYRGEVIGSGFFNWYEPGRINIYLRTIGYDYPTGSVSDYEYAVEHKNDIPVWPQDNSIVKMNDMIIVRFSDSVDEVKKISPRVNEFNHIMKE